MNRIISKSRLSDNVYKMQIEAPLVAQTTSSASGFLSQLPTQTSKKAR